MGALHFAGIQRASCRVGSLRLPSGASSSHSQACSPPLGLFLGAWDSDLFGDGSKTGLRAGAGRESPRCSSRALRRKVCFMIEHSINLYLRGLEKCSSVGRK